MNNYRPHLGMPPAVKIIIIINAAIFLLVNIASGMGYDLVALLGMHLPGARDFHLFQYITHMFTQEGLAHFFFNMYAVFMFGKILEMVWGAKRFVIYYLVCGFGAALLHSLVSWWGIHNMQEQYQFFLDSPDPALMADFARKYPTSMVPRANQILSAWMSDSSNSYYIAEARSFFELTIAAYKNIPTIGASGAVFGILLAFGMLFPNTELYLMFIPIPIKAKYFVIGYGLIELFFGIQNRAGDNVAHFAHLGGMIFGYFLIRYWKKHSRRFY